MLGRYRIKCISMGHFIMQVITCRDLLYCKLYTKQQNFILVQIERICRWQNNSNLKIGIRFEKRVENIVGKGENAGDQYFLLFPQCFQKLSFSGLLKVWTVW